jgi:nitrogenase molybdenum-iron protein NifN
VVVVNTPDYAGCLESGFAMALEAIIDVLVPETRHVGRRRKQVNVLASSMLTPGDIEVIKDWIEGFGLRPVVLPDIGDSLDGHLVEAEFTPLTLGGTPRNEIEAMGESIATLVIGRSLSRAADLLKARTGVPDFRFDHLMGLDASDTFTQTLAELSEQPVSSRLERQRAQLQDAMVDTHFMLGFARIALGLDPDLLLGFAAFFAGLGADIVAAVSPARAECLADIVCDAVQIGDLEDLERAAAAHSAQLLVASSHGLQGAERLGIPLLRAGFPQYDWVGGYARAWVGYRSARQALFDIANLILGQHHEIPAYRSIFRTEPERAQAGAGLVRH